MSYSTDVCKAIHYAYDVHRGQVDKAGRDYTDHLRRVAGRMKTPVMQVVAWLHDSIEDTDTTYEIIVELFGEDTAKSVLAITHRDGETYSEYLTRVKRDPVARAVKISDLIDNSNLSRLDTVTVKDVERQAKYNMALSYLMD